MRHRCFDDDVLVKVAALEPIDDFAHERGDVFGVGRLVDQAAVATGDPDRAGAPTARTLVALKEAGVEVEVENDAVEPVEAGIACHRSDVLQCACVAGDGHPVFVVEVRGFVAADDRDRVGHGYVEALDRG